MTAKWNGPPVPIRNRRAGKLLRFGDQNFPDNTENGVEAQPARRATLRTSRLLDFCSRKELIREFVEADEGDDE